MWESSKILDDFDFDETFANPKRSNVIEANINESPFDNLPEEVTRRIFSYLPITSIAQLSRVCTMSSNSNLFRFANTGKHLLGNTPISTSPPHHIK